MSLITVCIIFNLVACLNTARGGDPPGHLKPIGSHVAPLPLDEIDAFPGPVDFFDNYVKASKPVLFKGAAKQFPSFNNWKDDEYLK